MLTENIFSFIKKQNPNFCALGVGAPTEIKGAYMGERSFFISNLKGQTLVVSPSLSLCQEYKRNLVKMGKRVLVLTDVIDSLAHQISEPVGERELFDVLSNLCNKSVDVVVMYSPLAMQRVPSKKDYANSILNLSVNANYNLQELVRKLVLLGYEQNPDLDCACSFRLKGDTLDIYLNNDENITRLEFFDDTLEDIRSIDVATFSTVQKLQSVQIEPLNFCAFNGSEERGYANICSSAKCDQNIFSWFDKDNVVFDEPARCFAVLEKTYLDQQKIIESRINEGLLDGKYKQFYLNEKNWRNFNKAKTISFSSLDVANPFVFGAKDIYFSCPSSMKYGNDVTQFYKDVVRFDRLNYTIIICYQNLQAKNILVTRLKALNLKFNDSKEDGIVKAQINIIKAELEVGFGFLDEKTVVFTTQSFQGYNDQQEKVVSKKDKNRVFYLPKVGEYVVHEKYGIAKCEAIQKLNFGVNEKDYFVLTFASNGKLYLPSEHLNELSSYVGEENPKLDTLGSESFKKAKEKARASIKKLAYDLRSLYALRASKKGDKYDINEELINELIDSFGFELTDDQKQAVNDVKQDLSQGKIMDRLVCGDVGFGKTEVAIVASFIAVLNHKQVAILVPTSVLCQQHFTNFTHRLKDFGINVGMLSRFQTNAQNKQTIEGLKNGSINIVCGTKRMLSADVEFGDLGLLVLDEEQRFGVNDKEKIKNLKQDVNVLTLSATPIPRTLNMSLIGVRDISLIATPPKNRQSVQTIVCVQNNEQVARACRQEMDRGGQVLVIYNRVEDIFYVANKLSKLLPDAVVGVAHGQMSRAELESAIKNLYDQKTQILVATTLIENGVDLPLANTLIVLNAGNFGLSQLYQLRGRVGRSNRRAYAYFMYKDEHTLTTGGYERLKALKSFTSLGSGFKIAMRDLELRGAGDILGANQSGHIAKIGYDLYCKLIQEALDENAEQTTERQDVYIETVLPAFIAHTYIEDEEERIGVYNSISILKEEEQVLELLANLKKTYGEVPKEVANLCQVGLIKNIAQQINVKKIQIKGNFGIVEFYSKPQDWVYNILQDKEFVLSSNSSTKFEYRKNYGAEQVQQYIKNTLVLIKNNDKNNK